MGKVKILATMAIFIIFFSCKGKPPPQILHPPPVPEEKRIPVDYVFLLDNSGSIPKGEARAFAREAIKAFIDLAEPEDRVSLITFDRWARIIASEMIRDEGNRNRLKNALESKLTFKGTHTDISKGIALLKEKNSGLFRGLSAAKPAVILISDGKLEPKGNLQGAYNQLIRDWQSLSDLVPFYTFGLGETEIYKEFLPKVSGQSLLTQIAEASGGRFYPVRSVEELIETCVHVIRHTKGYGELAGQEIFWTDDSTFRLALLVIKRLPDRQICKTQDIRIRDPEGRKIGFLEARGYREDKTRVLWHKGTYYDLVMVERPPTGEWAVSLISGETPKVVALIRNQIHLRYLVRREYWDQERKVIMAWLYDERTGALSERPCQVNLLVDLLKAFPTTENKTQLQKTKEGTYLAYIKLAGKEPPIGEYLLGILAEDKGGFFVRKGQTINVRVKGAYFSFNLPKDPIHKWPIFWKGLRFAAELDSTHQFYPRFQEPPKISLDSEKIEEEKTVSLPRIELPCRRSNGKILYQISRRDLGLGQYGAYYIMEGRLTSGKKVRVESPEFYFTLVWPFWAWIGSAILVFIVVVFGVYVGRPKLSGRLSFVRPEGRPPIILTKHKRARKSFKGDSLRLGSGGDELTELGHTSFTLTALRGKGLKIKVQDGNVSLKRDEQTRSITTTALFRGDIITFADGEANYVAEIISPKRRPRKRRR